MLEYSQYIPKTKQLIKNHFYLKKNLNSILKS